MPRRQIQIAVCGGGIGGLTFALAASSHPNLSVHVYEASSRFSSFGAGIGIWPRTWDVLKRLGFPDTDASEGEHALKSSAMIVLRKSDEPEGYEFLKMFSEGSIQTLHRGDLQHALEQLLPASCGINYSKHLDSYTRLQSGHIQLTFQDGSQANYDVLIGADGLKSHVRKCFMDEEARRVLDKGDEKAAKDILASSEPTWTGSVAFRELVPLSRLQKDGEARRLIVPQCPTQFVGKNVKHSPELGEGDGLINMVLFHSQPELEDSVYDGPWSAQVDEPNPFHFALFDDWEADARAWIKCMENPTKWAVHVVKPLHSFANDSVALIGDAAHAMDPHQGAGAGQAIEDAYVLAELLSCADSVDTVPYCLRVYDSIRRPIAQQIARHSRDNAHLFSLHWDGLEGYDVRDRLEELGGLITERWKWAWRLDVAELVEAGKQEVLELAAVLRSAHRLI